MRYTLLVLARTLSACALGLALSIFGCSGSRGAEGTWEVSPPAIATSAGEKLDIPAPKATLTVNGDGSFDLAVEGSSRESARGTWEGQGNMLSFRVKGDNGVEHSFDGSLSEDGDTLEAFGFQFKRR